MIDPAVLALFPTFRVVAMTGSFTAASGRLGVSPSAVSQAIRRLEELIGARLFERTSRSVRLTEAGEALRDSVALPLDQLGSAVEDAAARANGDPSGVLRITLSRLAAEVCILDRLVGFADAFPRITLELSTDDRLTDIVAGGFDGGIRLREVLEKDMVARRIGPPLRRSLLASPAYIARHGAPRTLRDLPAHRVIRYRYPGSERLEALRFLEAGMRVLADPAPVMVLDDNGHIGRVVREGLGVAQRFRVTEEEAIRSGELVELLPDCEPEPMQFFVYFPSRVRQPAKLTAFLEWFCRPANA